MRKLTALYGGGKSCILQSEFAGGATEFKLLNAAYFKGSVVLYVYCNTLLRLEFDEKMSASLNGEAVALCAFVCENGRVVFEGGSNQSVRQRLKSRIMELEAKADFKEEKEEKQQPREYQSHAMREILEKARDLFSPLDEIKETEDNIKEESIFNPFPHLFPRSVWTRKENCLEGHAVKDGMRLLIYAKECEYANITPCMRRNGFKKFVRSSNKTGYWLKILRSNKPFDF